MNFKKNLLILLLLTVYLIPSQAQRTTISGKISEKGTGESLIGANVYVPSIKSGTTTNNYGFYSLTLSSDTAFDVVFSYVGYESQRVKIQPGTQTTLNIEFDKSKTLEAVQVTATKEENKIANNVQMSKINIPVAHIKNIPSLLGEKDVLKTLQLMPGVQKGNEGFSGLYVRGGGADQNLIILDDATVYNASHLFGFFSLFNGDAIKNIDMYKGGFPSRYGGRVSSVIDISMKDGNMQDYKGDISVGLISSRATIEGPIVKNKSSFLVSGRRTYIDILARPFLKANTETVPGYYFYDITSKANYTIDSKNRLFVSAYFGRDKFKSIFQENNNNRKTENGLFWENITTTARWNHIFNSQLFSNMSLIFSKYGMSIFQNEKAYNNNTSMKYNSGIRDFSYKWDFYYTPHFEHKIRFGLQTTTHRYKPSAIVLKNSNNNAFTNKVKTIDVLENGVFIEDDFSRGLWKANVGIRLSHFLTQKENYLNPEPRLMLGYQLDENQSLKASYTIMTQYTHLISNTGIGLPTDLWVPSTKNIVPQKSNQVAVGYAIDLPHNMSFSVESYYKESNNILGYKDGANFLFHDDPTDIAELSWEDNVTQGRGRSYGIELFLQRKIGKLTGWAGYTLSWTKYKFAELNEGKEFFARNDRRHDASLVLIYEINPNTTLSGAWVFSSGSAITMQNSHFVADAFSLDEDGYYSQMNSVYYGEKNSFRMRSYHRLDLGIQFHKQLKRGKRTWELGVYNAYNRKNPFFYFTESLGSGNSNGDEKIVLKQITLFPIIPSVSYSYSF